MLLGTFVTVLRTWGKTHNHRGRRPPTWRVVARVTIEVVEQRWCSACEQYLDRDQFKSDPKSGKCRACRRTPLAEQGELRVHKMRWRAQVQAAERRGAKPEISWPDWLEMLRDHGFCCGEAGCSRPYERVTHLVPLVWGGRHQRQNLRPHCLPCHLAHVRHQRRERHINRRDVVPIERWAIESREIS